MFKIYANDNLIYSPGDKTLPISQPKLTLEMGKAGSLDFQVPPMNPYYNQLGQLSTKISVREDETNEIFRGRVLSNERDFYNVRSVFCEGDLTYLVDSVQKAEKFSGKTHDLFRKIISAHNARMTADKQFTVGTINVENRDIILTGQGEESGDEGPIDYKQIIVNSVVDNWNTTFDFIQNTLIDYEGGYLRTRHVNNVNYIDLLTDYGVTSEQEIRIDSNMLDFTESISPEELFTVLIPLGDNNLTIASVNGGSDELVDTNAVAKYGRIVRTNVFQNVTDPNTLLENGRRYLTNNVNVPITFTIQAVDLHLLNPDVQAFHVGDRVKIVSEFHNVTEYMTCTKIEYDLENPGNTVYTFGNPKQTLTDRYRKDKRQSNDTYGSGGRGSGVAGAATDTWALVDGEVEGAVEEASENTEKQINESYDAWVKYKPGEAIIDLKTLYKKYAGVDPEVLTNTGMFFNGPKGTVNIFADHEQYEADRLKLKNNVGINLDAPAGTIDIFADHEEYTADRTKLKNNVGIDLDAPAGTIDIFSDHERTGVDELEAGATLHGKITVAMGQISSEVTRATEAEGTLSSRITQNSTGITSEVTRAQNTESSLSSTITQTANDIRLEVSQQYYGKKTGIEISDGGISLNGKTITATSGNFSVSSGGILSATGAQFDGNTMYGSAVSINSSGVITVGGTSGLIVCSVLNASDHITLGEDSISSWDDIVPKFG